MSLVDKNLETPYSNCGHILGKIHFAANNLNSIEECVKFNKACRNQITVPLIHEIGHPFSYHKFNGSSNMEASRMSSAVVLCMDGSQASAYLISG